MPIWFAPPPNAEAGTIKPAHSRWKKRRRAQQSLRRQARMSTWIGEVAGLRSQAPTLLELRPIGTKLVAWIVGDIVDPCCAVDPIADCQGPRSVPNEAVLPWRKGHICHQAAAEAHIDLHRACLRSTNQQPNPVQGSKPATQLVTRGDLPHSLLHVETESPLQKSEPWSTPFTWN